MNKLIRIWGLSNLLLSLTACHYGIGIANHENDYLNDDQSVASMNIPANMHFNTSAMNKATLPSFEQTKAEVSIYPPDTLTNMSAKSVAPPPPRETKITNEPTQSLMIHRDLKHSWVMVATALKTSGYRILDQDQSAYCFYILDVRGKGRALKESSSMYLVELHAKSAQLTRVSVMAKSRQPAPPQIAKEILNNIAAKLR